MLEKTHCLEVIILPCSCNPYITLLLCTMMPKLCGFYFAIAHSSAVNIQIFQELVSFLRVLYSPPYPRLPVSCDTKYIYQQRHCLSLWFNNFECSLRWLPSLKDDVVPLKCTYMWCVSQFASKLFGEAQQLKVHINIIAPLRVGLVGVVVVVLIAQTELVSFMGQHTLTTENIASSWLGLFI